MHRASTRRRRSASILPFTLNHLQLGLGMYAIIADGGRQYKVEEGQELEIDFRDLPKGDQLTFDTVLAVSGEAGLKVGTPSVTGASVTAEVVTATFGEKVYIQKFRRRKNYHRRTGHRQPFTKVRISKINAG